MLESRSASTGGSSTGIEVFVFGGSPRLALLLVTVLLVSPRAAMATMPGLSGPVPEPLAKAFEEGLFNLPERGRGIGVSAAQGTWRIPVILVSFPDLLLRFGADDFNRSLFDTTGATGTGSVFDYYQWASGRRLRVLGQVVATVQLPNPRSYYGAGSWGLNAINTPQNAYGAIYEALRLGQAGVDWSEFDADRDGYVDMLWLVHAGVGGEASQGQDRANLWSITSRMSAGWRSGTYFVTSDPAPGSGQFMRIDRFSILPELSAFSPDSLSEIGVFCHEFGHALGLPDLYDTTNLGSPVLNVGPGNWSLMSSGAWGGDGHSPRFPAHLSAWPLRFLGWDRTIRPARDTTIVLDPVTREGTIVEWWFEGEQEPEHFLIENRRLEGFDSRLLREGLLIYHVDESVIGSRLSTNNINASPARGLWLVEADGDSDLVLGRNRGDSEDPFPGASERLRFDDDTQPSTRTFANAVTSLAMSEITPVGDRVSFRLQVRSPAWLPPVDVTGPDYQPADSYGPARVSAVDENRTLHVVGSELRSGRTQVVLRGSNQGWTEPFQVSHSPRSAFDPTLALLPGGDLVIVWSDTRTTGRTELYFRSRIHGTWTPERLLLSEPGECRNPAIGIDARGIVYLAFRYLVSGTSRIRMMRFTYFSPFGQPIPVSPVTERPGSPAVVVDPTGIAYIVWPDQAKVPQRLSLASYRLESGLSPVRQVTAIAPPYAQLGATGVVDSRGRFHLAWLTSGPGINEVHYQWRARSGTVVVEDTLIDSRGELIQNPELTVDRDDRLHLVFEAWKEGISLIRYKRWDESRGWDARSAELTPAGAGGGRPRAFPTSRGDVDVTYVSYPDGRAHFMLRSRQFHPPLGVPFGPKLAADSHLALGPNPLRSGNPLAIFWSGPLEAAAPMLDLYDLAGRRIAAVPLQNSGDRWLGHLSTNVTSHWHSGIYFARVRNARAPAQRLVVIQ